MFFNNDFISTIIIANTIHGLFNYTIYKVVITPTLSTPAAETLIHSLILVMQFYLFIQV
jgi:hypothetical protein